MIFLPKRHLLLWQAIEALSRLHFLGIASTPRDHELWVRAYVVNGECNFSSHQKLIECVHGKTSSFESQVSLPVNTSLHGIAWLAHGGICILGWDERKQSPYSPTSSWIKPWVPQLLNSRMTKRENGAFEVKWKRRKKRMKFCDCFV